jgi:hypothetical protein
LGRNLNRLILGHGSDAGQVWGNLRQNITHGECGPVGRRVRCGERRRRWLEAEGLAAFQVIA